MTYQEALDWMFSRLPMYQRVGNQAFKKDLTNIIAFCNQLENPQNTFKTIHVGGTNGKGSTSHMLASILQEAGYRVGLYTSPHLKNFTERIRVNGTEVEQNFVHSFISKHKPFLSQQELSFFEMTVGMAFAYFSHQKVDVAVIEVGLGGRLDSTNIITPELSVITNIGLDHTQFLGDTRSQIASEKAGIIKKGIPVVVGERHLETDEVFTSKAKKERSAIFFAEDNFTEWQTDLKGNYQKKNVNTAFHAIKLLKGFSVEPKHIKRGLLNVVKNTRLKGRWQVLGENPKIICDTAHNKEGLLEVMKQLEQEKYQELHIVLGVVNDKKLEDILDLFPKKASYYFCKPEVPRGLSEKELQKKGNLLQLRGQSYVSVQQAFKEAKKTASKNDCIYIGGSTFVVAEVL